MKGYFMIRRGGPAWSRIATEPNEGVADITPVLHNRCEGRKPQFRA